VPARRRATPHAEGAPGLAGRALIASIRAGLRAAADPERAPGMRAYMKSAMPYHGVPMPEQRRITRAAIAEHPLGSSEEWRATMRELWRSATHREERYAALELAGHRRYRAFEDLDALPIYEEWIETGAWWDLGDWIAADRIGSLLRRHPRTIAPLMRRWARDANMWKRRTAILSQLRFRGETDLALLYDCIEPNVGDREFFIRKAIGWALREVAWADPDEVVRYVHENVERLSGLSKREALNNVLRSGRIAAVP